MWTDDFWRPQTHQDLTVWLQGYYRIRGITFRCTGKSKQQLLKIYQEVQTGE